MSKEKHKGWWRFSRREIRAVLLLLPLIAMLVWLSAEVFKPRFDDSAALLGDTLTHKNIGNPEQQIECPFDFDPNTVTYEELRSLGIAKNTAASIIRYREAGKVFRIPEDFAACYGVSDSMYAALKPHITIGSRYKIANKSPEPNSKNYFTSRKDKTPYSNRNSAEASGAQQIPEAFDPNLLDADGFTALGFSPRQADVIIRYRKSIGGFRTAEDFAKSYVVSDGMFARLKDRIAIGKAKSTTSEPSTTNTRTDKTTGKTEINGADSAALIEVKGIGAKSAQAIIAYRRRLGGYHNIVQICETGVVTERNWEMIREQICVDSCVIQKIDINFASPNVIGLHPYMSRKTLRKLLRNRQLRGGWSTIEDMVSDNTLTPSEAKQLAPYLQFKH